MKSRTIIASLLIAFAQNATAVDIEEITTLIKAGSTPVHFNILYHEDYYYSGVINEGAASTVILITRTAKDGTTNVFQIKHASVRDALIKTLNQCKSEKAPFIPPGPAFVIRLKAKDGGERNLMYGYGSIKVLHRIWLPILKQSASK